MTRRATLPILLCAALVWGGEAVAQRQATSARPVPTGRPEVVQGPVTVGPARESRGQRGDAPPNDACDQALLIPVLDPIECGAFPTLGTTAGTVTSNDPTGCSTSASGFADVWYTFNSGDWAEVTINLDPVDMGHWAFSLQTSCDVSTELACFQYPGGDIPVAVQPNTDYWLRCFTSLDSGDPGAFTLCVKYHPFMPPANDDCGTPQAIDVVLVDECATEATAGTTLGATIVQDDPNCDGSTVGYADVWYSFNSGDNSQLFVTLERDVAVVQDLGFTIQAACDPATESACFVNPWETKQIIVEPNTDYLLRCFNNLRWGVRGDFTVCVAALPPVAPPDNDECGSVTPEALAAGSSLTFSGDVSGATGDGDFVPGSEFDVEMAVWHAFTTTECTNVVVSYCGTEAVFGSVYLVLSPSCPMGDDAIFTTSWANTCANGNANIYFAELPAGTYYLPVLQDYVAGSYGAYEISVTAVACDAVPVNDHCADVDPVEIPVGTSHSFQGDLTNATDDDDFEPGSIWEGSMPAVWHAFTITECADITLNYCGSEFPLGIVYYHLVVSCPASSDSLAGDVDFFSCPTGNAIITFEGIPAGTYYIPVMSDPGNNAYSPYTLEVIVDACPLPPANDECSGAIELIPASTCTEIQGTVEGATQTLAPQDCGLGQSPVAEDVWFSFEANDDEQTITVFGHGAFDAVVELYEGGCDGLTSIDCVDETLVIFNPVNEVMEATGLTVGETYYVRVYDFAAGSDDPTFGICVTGDSSTGLDELAEGTFAVFPNPSSGAINVRYTGVAGTVQVELLDLAGRTVITEQHALQQGQVMTLGLTDRPAAGTYVLRLSSAHGRSEQRVILN